IHIAYPDGIFSEIIFLVFSTFFDNLLASLVRGSRNSDLFRNYLRYLSFLLTWFKGSIERSGGFKGSIERSGGFLALPFPINHMFKAIINGVQRKCLV
ncbi:MAG: hypothetical protein WBE34_21655, partial [Candidatus Nitrosopolaris sp.]